MTVPTVVTGRRPATARPRGVVLPCTTSAGPFAVEVCVRPA